MGAFQVAEGTVQVVFDMWFMYETNIFDDTFNNTRDALPWVMPNALEMDVAAYAKYNMYGIDLDSLNPFTKRQKFDKDAELSLFTIELYTIRGNLKLITFPSEDPFQSIFLVFKLAMDGTPGSEMTVFQASEGNVI